MRWASLVGQFGLLYQAGLAKAFFLLKIVVVCMRGQAGRLSESPLLRACEIQGAQHQIPLKKDFLVLPRAKVRCQGPQGTARAHGVPFTGALPYVMWRYAEGGWVVTIRLGAWRSSLEVHFKKDHKKINNRNENAVSKTFANRMTHSCFIPTFAFYLLSLLHESVEK